MALTDAQKKARDKYNSKAYRSFVIKANRLLEPEVVEFLESQKSVQGYILNLVREDMKKS